MDLNLNASMYQFRGPIIIIHLVTKFPFSKLVQEMQNAHFHAHLYSKTREKMIVSIELRAYI